MNLELSGKVVAITGPAKGMGTAITRAFAAEGARLVLLARDLASVVPLKKSLEAEGVTFLALYCDVTDAESCTRAVAEAEQYFGSAMDVLVNVAGGTGPIGKTGVDTSREEFDEIIRLNLIGSFNTIRAVLPGMIDRRYGKIVNVGGTFGMRGKAGRLAYSASKWGLRGLTKSLALEVGEYGINVNIVAPGMVDGPRFRDKVCRDMAARLDITESEAADRHAQDYALRRISTAEDVAHACLYLASDCARQITGTDLAVDGGWAHL